MATLAWVAIWQLAATLVAQPLLLPGPWDTLEALVGLLGSASFWASVLATFSTIAGAFALSLVAALALGDLASRLPWLRAFLRPVALVLKATPVACIVVLLLLWLGAQGVPVAAVALVVFPAYYFTTLEATASIDHGLADALKVMGVRPLRVFLVHGWPEMLPFMVATSRSAVGMSWKAGVAAELIAMAADTFGERIYQAKLLLETPELFAWTIALVALASLSERAFCALLARTDRATRRLAMALGAHESWEAVAERSPGSIAVRHLSVARGGREVVDDLSLAVGPGEALCLRGPSGRGKTTLVLAILGLVRPSSGTVERPRRLSVVFQETRLVEALSMADNVRLVAPHVADAEVERILGRLLPDVDPARPARELSGGQRRRLEIARAILCPGGAVVMDEPFQGLARQAHERACALIRAELGARALVLATHDDTDAALLRASSLTVP